MTSSSSSLAVDAIIRRRVLSRDSELSGVLSRWRSYAAALQHHQQQQSEQSLHAAEECYHSLLQSLDSLRFLVSRQSVVHSAVDCELSACDRSAAESRLTTSGLRSDIAQLKTQLHQATNERQHRVQVDFIAAQCNLMASRADTQSLIAALQSDIAELEAEQTDMELEQDSRRRQFGLIALALDTVSSQWTKQRSTRSDEMAVG